MAGLSSLQDSPDSRHTQDFISLLTDDDSDDANEENVSSSDLMHARFHEYEQSISDKKRKRDPSSEEDSEDHGKQTQRMRHESKNKPEKRRGPDPSAGRLSGDTINRKDSAVWLRKHSLNGACDVATLLNLEIKDFVAYLSPSQEEIEARNIAVRRVQDLVSRIWQDAKALVFGSFATDLYLPGSDIDIVVVSDSGRLTDKSCLYQLSAALRRENIGKEIEVIARTRVPIIKFVERQTGICIDLSFERLNGLAAAETITVWKSRFPSLRNLVLVIKQFLARRKLNEVHTGGLGGFAIICLVVSFLALHPQISCGTMNIDDNLGVLLMEFFELYGKRFNYPRVALDMSDPISYKSTSAVSHLTTKAHMSLIILDPNDSSNNISRSSFNVPSIRRAFAGAFEMLTSRCYDLSRDRAALKSGSASILISIIQLVGPARDFEDFTNFVENRSAVSLASIKTGATQPTNQKLTLKEFEALYNKRATGSAGSTLSKAKMSPAYRGEKLTYEEFLALYESQDTKEAKSRHGSQRKSIQPAVEYFLEISSDEESGGENTSPSIQPVMNIELDNSESSDDLDSPKSSRTRIRPAQKQKHAPARYRNKSLPRRPA